ncbi:hypothetical protein SAMN04488540_10563 [Ferrimonas sediminum]|uniref:Uncharacterized protein n=1 Tax=Ferrimonas sediminum TaxID=718193 RepID=A0A1G8R598_9GAMM|nr:hypothetical protein SAMN04488540_10563 [Ferrimonas sediminum]
MELRLILINKMHRFSCFSTSHFSARIELAHTKLTICKVLIKNVK